MRVNNEELLQKSQVLNMAASQEAFSSTSIKYGLSENIDRIEDSLETFREEAQEMAEEHDVEDMDQPESEMPDEFVEELSNLQETEGEFDPYFVPKEDLEAEEEVPFQFIHSLKWMFKPKEQIGN